ncbi:MAG: thiamine phosphate synthase [Sulfobacillus sp.]|nr:thiamine phosphate synthase [Sulfobacillus sp.]
MDLRLMVIIDPRQVPVDQLGAFCREVRQGGATVIQLRGKTRSTRELVTYGRALRVETRRHGLSLIVNDRTDVALAIQADGVHVGQDDMPVRDVRRMAPGLTVGLSVSAPEEIPAQPADWPDYFGVGPVYATSSKDDAGDPLGVEGLRSLWQECRRIAPVVAIGGITPTNVGPLWQLPVAGVAVISAVVLAPDKKLACRQLISGKEISG